jgi:hypothetical protein
MAPFIRLLPAILLAGLLAGCADEQASYSPSLGFNGNAGANTGAEPSTDMLPSPPPGADYYTDRWTDSGNQLEHGQYSNW